jgi:heptosyltransferase-2
LGTRSKLKAERLSLNKIHRVVVRLPNWLGDVVMAVPALRELRRILPHAHLTVVSRSDTADIFIDADYVDKVLVYDRAGLSSAWHQAVTWRDRKFDLSVLFQNAFEAAVIAFLARVPARIGYETERRGALLTHPLAAPDWKDKRHESFYYLNIVTELERLLYGASSIETTEPRFDLRVSEDRKRKAFDLLLEHGARANAPLTLLCPGSVNSRAKRWPAERYAALADLLVESGANVALIGSPGESGVTQEVCKHAQRQLVVLTGKTTIAEATALISIADVLITNDTGPAHIGAALSTPTLVIFGPTNPLTTYPLSSNAEIVRRAPDCAPCMLRDCPIDHRCMTAIAPEEVFERASAFISRRAEVIA